MATSAGERLFLNDNSLPRAAGIGMSRSKGLRERAAKLLALAVSVREAGSVAQADVLTEMANENLAQAEETERRAQQQPRTDDPDKK